MSKKKENKKETKGKEEKTKNKSNKQHSKDNKSKKNKIIKTSLAIIKVFIVILLSLTITQYYQEQVRIKEEQQKEEARQKLIKEITSHYNNYVKTTKETTLYELDQEEYRKIGTIAKDVELTLEKIEIDEKIKYFKVQDKNQYIEYKTVTPIDSVSEIDTRFLRYIPFNENVVTKEGYKIYNQDGNQLYTLDKSKTYPILIKEDDKYYVNHDNQLVYILKEDISTVEQAANQTEEIATKIRAVTYHAIYKVGVETDCVTIICHPEEQLESHANYLKENNFFTLTMQEVDWYIDGKINLPKKSIIITIDDGYLAERGIIILDKYKLNATVFLVTAWYTPDNFTQSKYIEFHSHGDNLHNQGICPGGQGGAIKCADKQELLTDLATSREKLNNSTVFCYPFYEYNNYSIEVLKEAGFTLAFAGYKNGAWVVPGTSKLEIPRYTVTNDESLQHFISEVTPY